ncbi:MAG: phosphoribosylamine--glycine ligase [Bacteroidota bacterium]|jgi:phosphoribosylamine--glycine ligase
MNILLLGSGGRENAFAWKISQSPLCGKLFIAPGNAGSTRFGTNIAVSATDFDKIKEVVVDNDINLVVVGPEDPLVKGIRDYFESDPLLCHIPMVGPGKAGAMLEGSKDFSKKFMFRNGIPTAKYATFSSENIESGMEFLESMSAPYVLKADGLAAGKGVLILDNLSDAKKELRSMLIDSKFGEASSTVVIEEFLSGIELSVFVLTDGKDYVILPEAKDYKRIGEGDTGLNTGGMGAVSPVPFADSSFMEKVEERIVKPTIQGLANEGIPYAGFIFIGLMRVDSDPFVIEYNVRMGDPETEVVLPRIQSDLVELLIGSATGKLKDVAMEISDQTALTVIMASRGYPGEIEKGKTISGMEDCVGSLVFHAGTTMKDGNLQTSGGRVFAITSVGANIADAKEKSMQCAHCIDFDGKYFRRDIGEDLMKFA